MSNQTEKYYTVRYRTNSKTFSLDTILHKGKLSIIRCGDTSLYVEQTNKANAVIAQINYQDIVKVYAKLGAVYVETADVVHVFDFSSIFYEGIRKSVSTRSGAADLLSFLQKITS